MDLGLQIQADYSTMSKANRKVADFLLHFPDSFLDLSAMEIGEKSGASSATVIRFARQMGFGSLEELKINLAKQLTKVQEPERLDPVISPEDSLENLAGKLTQMVAGTVELCLHQIDFALLKKALGYLKRAKTVYLYGIGASGNVAYDLYHKLNRANIRAVYSADSHMNIEMSVHATPRDVAIAFSYSGRTKEILLAARQAQARGAKVIAVTRSQPSPLASLADVVLTVPNNEHLLRIGALASLHSSLWVSDLLFLGAIQEDYENIEKGFLKTAQAVLDLKAPESKVRPSEP